MAENSKIEWTDHSWNWAQGCPKNNDSRELACKNCYMYREKTWHGQNPAVVVRSAKLTFNFPLISKKLKPGDKIFTCSWADFFNETLDPWREEAWDIIRRTPQYIYQILTKWPENIKDRLPADWGNGWSNVWLLATVENQEMVNKRIPELLQIPAVVHGVSIEPMLGAVGLSCLSLGGGIFLNALSGKLKCYNEFGGMKDVIKDNHKLDWIIVGGETGPGARPVHPEWVRNLRDQCVAAEVPFFFKQWGEWLPISQMVNNSESLYYPRPDDPEYDPDASRKCKCQTGSLQLSGELLPVDSIGAWGFGSMQTFRVGKKAAGALLDGQEWRQFPEVTER
jgi:protein gp37